LHLHAFLQTFLSIRVYMHDAFGITEGWLSHLPNAARSSIGKTNVSKCSTIAIERNGPASAGFLFRDAARGLL
jgi:hypothetical protein